MTPTTKTVPQTMRLTTWLPEYVILGTGDYKCFRRLSLNDLMKLEESSDPKDKVFILRLKTASLATNAIIRKLMLQARFPKGWSTKGKES